MEPGVPKTQRRKERKIPPAGMFHHRPDEALKPASKIETAYHKADHAFQHVLDLLAA